MSFFLGVFLHAGLVPPKKAYTPPFPPTGEAKKQGGILGVMGVLNDGQSLLLGLDQDVEVAFVEAYPQDPLGHIQAVEQKQINPAGAKRSISLRTSRVLAGTSLPTVEIGSKPPIRHTLSVMTSRPQ